VDRRSGTAGAAGQFDGVIPPTAGDVR
jgi:hypothetical protein